MAKWVLNNNDADIKLMSKVLNISEITSYILANRNIRTKKTAIKYLNPSLDYLQDLKNMKDVKKAISIIFEAKKNNDKVIIYGDYDVDGVMSTVILLKALKQIGLDIDYYIPDREIEGYGLNIEAVKKLKELETDLLITCDNGIQSIEEIKLAKELGMKVIVIDHHNPSFKEEKGTRIDILPIADAIVDPKQTNCQYPFKLMCAGAISYRFVEEIYKNLNIPFDSKKELLIFASIATICDIVDLFDENRIIAKNGLYFLNNNEELNLGLKQLIKTKDINNKELSCVDVGFIIGPCINASGRLDKALLAVDLFMTDDEKRAFELSNTLSDLNNMRKNMTNKYSEKIINSLIENQEKIKPIIIVYDMDIHESIAGIIAGRIKEYFFHPTLVFTKGENYVKGSGRSIEAYDIFENLFKNRDLFIRFGGHPMAAGLSLLEENIKKLDHRLNSDCELLEEDFTEIINIEKILYLNDISFDLVNELNYLAPFGKGNKEPVFVSYNIKIESLRIIPEKNTIIFEFKKEDNKNFIKGICFGMVEKFTNQITSLFDKNCCDNIIKGDLTNTNFKINIVYSISINEFRNNISLQLKIKDFVIIKI